MSAPRIPISEKYWIKKGKSGKDVMIYTHDDLDGIYSAIVIKTWMEERGFDIKGYGVMNYQEAWRYTTLNPKMINVVVDYANMPEILRKDLIDVYIDHHGVFDDDETELFKLDPVIKTVTDSAYEGLCLQLGVPCDELLLDSIDMVDSAKYTDYDVDWRDILNFSWNHFMEVSKKKGIKIAKLTFAGAFNQFIKRSDHRTIVETIYNMNYPSIYAIYLVMKKLYPKNNGKKDFIEDGKKRIQSMTKRVIGNYKEREKDSYVPSYRNIFKKQTDFYNHNKKSDGFLSPKGYQLIGNLVFIPSGTWANALRARSVILKEYDLGIIPPNHRIDFIMLQYGNTLQVCGFDKIDEAEEFPTLKDGRIINNLGTYMGEVLDDFKNMFGYYDPDTSTGQDELTVFGGHAGIGTISNIVGQVDKKRIKKRSEWKKKKLDPGALKNIEKHDGQRYLDLFKNKIIRDLSGISWNKLDMIWAQKRENEMKIPDMDHKVLLIDDLKRIDVFGNVQSSMNDIISINKDIIPEEDEVL